MIKNLAFRLAIAIAVFVPLLGIAGLVESHAHFTLTQGGMTKTVEPIEGAADVVSFYDYYSASAHTPYVEDQVSKIYLYQDPDGNISLVMHHSIDNSVSNHMREDFDLEGVPPSAYVAVSDDIYSTGPEFSLTSSPEGQWGHGYNSDGGVLAGLPTGEPWCIRITPDFIAGIKRWAFETPDGPENLDMDMPIKICFIPEPVKWQQRPDMVQGVNIVSHPKPEMGNVADDWLCLDGSPVSDLHFWGSYPGWMEETGVPPEPTPGVQAFRIQVYSDAPSTQPGVFSHPANLLYEVWVRDFTETYVASILLPWQAYEHKYRYDLDLPRIFWQKRDTIYWLNISAVPRVNDFPWGWESSRDRWNDFAVKGWYENPRNWWWDLIYHPWTEEFIDMSFELTTLEGPIKWLQFPDMAEGINIGSLPMDPVVADDFLCTDGGAITEVHFWGSYLDKPYGPGKHWEQGNPGPPLKPLPPTPGLRAFKLSFHKDIPAGVDPDMPWSHPGELLREIRVDFGKVEERYWDSVPHIDPQGTIWWEHKFYYIVYLEEPFRQEEGKIYWLDIGAIPIAVIPTWYWGWETSKDHWNDNAVLGWNEGQWWEELGHSSIGFEDLILGTTYHVGDTFTTSGVPVTVKPFQWSNGQWTNDGFTRVENGGMAGGSGNEMAVCNVNLDFGSGISINGLSLLFGEYGGNLNIEINGDFRNFNNFSDINGLTIGGVNVSVIDFGDSKGRLTLTGLIEQFAVGGQELWIDNGEYSMLVDMAFLLITEDYVPYCECDLNRDGVCDMQDWLKFGEDWGRTDCYFTGDCECDLNYDGVCDMQDWLLFGEDWGRTDCPN